MSEPAATGARWIVDHRAVIDALPRAIIVTGLDGRIELWNRRAEEVYGWTAAEVLGRSVTDVLVPVSDLVQADDILTAVRDGGVWAGDFTVLKRDGEPVRVWVTDRPVLDDSGAVVAILGASEDVSAQRLLERQTADLTEHLQLALEAGGLGTFRWDLATGETEWDPRVEAQFGLEPGTFDGSYETWVSLLHPDDRDVVLGTVADAVTARGHYTVEHRVVWPDGSTHWLHGAGQVTLDSSGAVTGTIGCTRDITDQVLAERERQRLTLEAIESAEQERVNGERLQFLSRINEALATARDLHELMVNVSRAAVPRLGDWCSIFVLPTADAVVPDVEIAHVDPAMVEYARELQAQFPYDPDSPVGMPKVIRTGELDFFPDIEVALAVGSDAPPETREVVRRLALRSAIAVPLVKRGRILGGLQLVMSESSRRYTEVDVALTEAIASRVAASIENLRLSAEHRAIAKTLQASLLPDRLPDIPGVDVAVRYWASGEGVDVGGDFYDVFELTAGAWALVIGDVCGKGPSAAAVTGLARHTIASAAWHGDPPELVLANLNRSMLARGSDSFCTAIYGSLEPSEHGARLSFACGGHPLPILVRSDGSSTPVGSHGSLIGLFDTIDVTTTELDLGPGEALVLYTDGATDVAPPAGLRTDELAALVAEAARSTTTAEGLADRLDQDLSAILDINERSDDIALLVLRLPGAAPTG